MPGWPYKKGVIEIADGAYAYLQPDGGWGWSNAGMVRDGDQALLIDTLFDEHLTHDMLNALTAATGCKVEQIGSLVNTHANGDHTHGNALLPRGSGGVPMSVPSCTRSIRCRLLCGLHDRSGPFASDTCSRSSMRCRILLG